MAGVLRLLVKLDTENITPPQSLGGTRKRITQTNPGGGNPGKVVATAAGNAVDFGGLTALGVCVLTNTNDDGGDVAWFGPDSGSSAIKECIELWPGEDNVVRLKPGVTYYVKGDGADVPLSIRAFEK